MRRVRLNVMLSALPSIQLVEDKFGRDDNCILNVIVSRRDNEKQIITNGRNLITPIIDSNYLNAATPA